MSYLALDVATLSGFCLICPIHGKILQAGRINAKIRTKAAKTIAADHQGRRLQIFNEELMKVMRYAERIGDPVTHIIYERITTGRAAGGKTSAVARHLEAMVIRTSYLHDTQLLDVASNTIKRWATGDGSNNRPEINGKQAMMKVAESKFTETVKFLKQQDSWDDNVADAMLIAAWAVQNLED